MSLRDYDVKSGDSEALGLITVRKERYLVEPVILPDISNHAKKEFARLFGDLPFHDLNEGVDKRREDNLRRSIRPYSREFDDEFRAAEEARRNALYGGRAGAIYCDIQVKRRVFPILYEITCDISTRSDLRNVMCSNISEHHDIGFSSPEHIVGSIKTSLASLMEGMSAKMKKIRKYDRRN